MAASRRTAVASLLAVLVLASFCSQGEASAASSRRLLQYTNVAQALAYTPQFSTLNAAVAAAGLTPIFSNSSLSWTLFAPTNEAFTNLVNTLNTTASALLKQTALVNLVVKYHVVTTAYKASSLQSGQVLPTLLGSGQNLVVDTEGSNILIQGYASEALVTARDGAVGQTIIQTVDHVLIPKLG